MIYIISILIIQTMLSFRVNTAGSNVSRCWEKSQSRYTVIHNGVYTDVFYPNNEIKTGKKYKFITTGNFRNIDMLEP